MSGHGCSRRRLPYIWIVAQRIGNERRTNQKLDFAESIGTKGFSLNQQHPNARSGTSFCTNQYECLLQKDVPNCGSAMADIIADR
jgi:hypothetical protein